MNIKSELDIVKKLVKDGYITEMVIEHLAEKKIHHSGAIFIVSIVFNHTRDFSRQLIYDHEYYAPFENERNPFNEEIGEIHIKLNEDGDIDNVDEDEIDDEIDCKE